MKNKIENIIKGSTGIDKNIYIEDEIRNGNSSIKAFKLDAGTIEEWKAEIEKLWDQYEKTESRERQIFIRSNILNIQKKIDHLEHEIFEKELERYREG